MTDPQYVRARAVLLDAIEALSDHIDAVVLVGAQAIYLHTGEGDLAVAPYTTDADLSIHPDDLADDPLLESLLTRAGFQRERDPGRWASADGIYVDVMVPEALAGVGTRSADLAPHGKHTARRAKGLEGTLVDRDRVRIESLDPNDERSATIWVAGPGALLVAKIHKIAERAGLPDRVRDKDALDVLRLLRAIPTTDLSQRIQLLLASDLAESVTSEALELARALFGTRTSDGVESAVRAAGRGENPVTIGDSLIALVDDLLRSL